VSIAIICYSFFNARLVITICILVIMVSIGVDYQFMISQVAIKKMVEASQRMLRINNEGELGGIGPLLKGHLEVEIKTLENAPRQADKLRRLLQIKQRQKEEAMDIEDRQGVVTEEIEMLKLYCIYCRGREGKWLKREDT
jgi:uncharacterized protein YdbL (DUF1318 family)